ncbi:MAG: sel1 repeat family protein [Thiotrichales bacterium]|nr:sel1 repeat family protein [Thiotrichales bacterium]
MLNMFQLLLLLTFITACSGMDDPKLAFAEGDFETSYQLWKPLAEEGNPEAENYLGVHYYTGLGVKRDYAKALHWYESAARKGFPSAQRHYGDMFMNGHGTQQDFYKAFLWYFAASQQGNDEAKLKLESLTAGNKLTPNQQMHAKIDANEFILDVENRFISHDTYIKDKKLSGRQLETSR